MTVRGRRALGVTLAVVALAVLLVAVELVQPFGFSVMHPFAARQRTGEQAPGNGSDTALATVVRKSLSSRTNLDGTLGYARKYSVVNHAQGTITALPTVGRVVRQGEVLYRVNGEPVVLLYGKSPAYRSLAQGTKSADVTGRDVKQLNRALVSLGYANGLGLDPTSDEFGWATKVAVQRLQAALGMAETGKLALGQLAFLPTAARVVAVPTALGAVVQDGVTVLSASSTTRQVVVDLDATRQSEIKVGDKVTITLPNGKTTPGKVTSVGRVASSSRSGAPTVKVRVRPTRPAATGRLDQASVQVSITTVTVKSALVVPVEALLALAGGGYAVEVETSSGTHQLVPVELGQFDEDAGLVQVSGSKLRTGQRVVVPAT